MKLHTWKYRNPADRTCEVCGERQTIWAHMFEDGNGNEYIASQKWEVAYPLAPSSTLCDFTWKKFWRWVWRQTFAIFLVGVIILLTEIFLSYLP